MSVESVLSGEARWHIEQGHVLDLLAGMPESSVHCVVTSPAYWGLRDYHLPAQVWGGEPECEHVWGHTLVDRAVTYDTKVRWNHRENGRGEVQGESADWERADASRGAWCQRCDAWRGSLGLEPDPGLYIEHIVEVFRAVRRVLRPDGTLWLNLGDTYYTAKGAAYNPGGGQTSFGMAVKDAGDLPGHRDAPNRMMPLAVAREMGLKPKDLVGLPWRVALALQADGWWLRADIIWAKPNPMPESVKDRPTRAARYFYDGEAVKEPTVARRESVKFPAGWDGGPGSHARVPNGRYPNRSGNKARKYDTPTRRNDHQATGIPWEDSDGRRNLRTVWNVATKPYPEAHFATFPPRLVEPCIKAGTSERGCCQECGAPMRRVVTKERIEYEGDWRADTRARDGFAENPVVHLGGGNTGFKTGPREVLSETWAATCKHLQEAEALAPAVVLDPFAGAATTGLVALRLGRSFVGLELSEAYCDLARDRIESDASLLNAT